MAVVLTPTQGPNDTLSNDFLFLLMTTAQEDDSVQPRTNKGEGFQDIQINTNTYLYIFIYFGMYI